MPGWARATTSAIGGDAKEARINEAFIKRFFYYLTTDERTGDLLREPLATVEASIARNPPLRKIAPRPDVPAPQAFLRVGPDWLALASNWLVEWERTGDTRYRDYCLTGMRDIGAMGDTFLKDDAFRVRSGHQAPAVGRCANQKPSQFLFLFAGDQIAVELQALIPCPPFTQAWGRLCEQFTQGKRANCISSRASPPMPPFHRIGGAEAKALALVPRAAEVWRCRLFPRDAGTVHRPVNGAGNAGEPRHQHVHARAGDPEVSQWAINLITVPVLLRKFAGTSG